MKRKTLIILGSVVGLLCACLAATSLAAYWVVSLPQVQSALEQASGSLTQMVELQQALAQEYPAEAVQVGVTNGHILTITLVNTAQSSSTDQRTQAKAIALFAQSHYAGISDVDQISVTFVQQAAAFGFSANTSYSYVFKLTELTNDENGYAIWVMKV